MAELNSQSNNSDKKHNHKRHSTKLDMTPMVDLAFLLLTFFILTTTFNKPAFMELNMPVPGPDSPINEKNAVTIMVGPQNQLVYYKGMFNQHDLSRFHTTNYSPNGLRAALMDMNKLLIDKISEIEADFSKGILTDSAYMEKVKQVKREYSNQGIIVMIKPTDEARYENIVTIFDEMKICNVVNYSLLDITEEEKKILSQL
jgi:biopolymer transport protein ExbD